MKSSKRGLVLFDPNPINPFGRELARVLQRDWEVTLYCTATVTSVPAGVNGRPILASSRFEDGLVRTIMLRLLGPPRALMHTRSGHQPLVVVWTRHSWEIALFTIAAALGASIVVINHNPARVRPRRGVPGRLEALLKRMATVTVVLGEELVSAARVESSNVMVAVHPSFLGWKDRYLDRGRSHTGVGGGRRRILLLGAMRPDKGMDVMPEVVRAIPDYAITIVVAGPGTPSEQWQADVRSTGAEVELVGSGEFVDDETLAAALNDADLIVAPYVGATQSSTAILALTCGVPMVAYRVGALPGLLTDRSLTPAGEPTPLGQRVVEFLSDPWHTWRVGEAELDMRCAAGWQRVINEVQSSRRVLRASRPART